MIYPLNFSFIATNAALYDSFTATGWTTTNGQVYTAVGMDLAWVNGFGGFYWQVTNIGDVTGPGPDLDRYISLVIDPADLYDATEWQTTFLGGFGIHQLDLGEGIELRSSMDGFSSTLMRIVGDGTNQGTGTYSPGAQEVPAGSGFIRYADFSPPYTPLVDDPATVQVDNQPVEFRFYYFGENLDGSAATYEIGATQGISSLSHQMVTVVAIPEPSKSLLMALAGTLVLLRRRRMA